MTATPVTLSKADLKRGRNMMWLIAGAAVSAAIAITAIATNRAAMSPAAMNEKLFPGLAETAAQAAAIRIESPTVYVTLNKGADGKWVVADRSNYPANPEGVRALVVSMSQLTLVERKTADPARHGALEVTTGEGGTGHAVTIQAADGSTLAAMVAGKVATRASGSTPGTLFLRRAGEDQTWLARGGIAIPASIGATLEKTLFTIAPERVKSVTIEPAGMKAYTLSRAAPDAPAFTLEAMPEGKEPATPDAFSAPATAMGRLTFDDVIKADALKIEKPTVATFRTFDGLVVTVAVVAGGVSDLFAIIEASAEGADAAPVAEAEAINARVAGWGYKLPPFIATSLTQPLETLLKDVAAAPAPEEEALPGEPEAAPPGVE